MNNNLRPPIGWLQWLGICVIVVALVAVALPVSAAHAQRQSSLSAFRPTPTPKPQPSGGASSFRLITQRIQKQGAAPAYEVDVRYPAVENPSGVWRTFNALSQADARSMIANFDADVAELGIITETSVPTSALAATWEAFRASPDFVSVRINYGVYMAGAAHPTSFTRVINFDPRTGSNLALSALFRPDVDYLGEIATYCTDVLRRRDVLVFPEGAAPLEENYANWNISRTHLVITFDVYQVAPYAAGEQECRIPLRRLRSLLATPARW